METRKQREVFSHDTVDVLIVVSISSYLMLVNQALGTLASLSAKS